MISALITGRIITDPAFGTTQTDKPFARITVATDVKQEKDVIVSCFVIDPPSIDALRKSKKGDSIAAQGSLEPTHYTGKDGQERSGFALAFARVLTVRAPKRGREE
jgi:hypothetical protein